ncbi:MAG: DEAD/DEAH box helicase, partial [Caldilineaceae bacterium]
LLWHFPARHEDYSQMRNIADLVVGEQATVVANLWEVQERKLGPTRSVIEATLSDGTSTLRANFWSKWVMRQLQPLKNTQLRLSGKIGAFRGQKTMENPLFEELDQDSVSTGRIAPIYPATEGLSQKKLRLLVRQVLEDFAVYIEEPLPWELLKEQGLPDVQTALWQYHFPDSAEQKDQAYRRFAFEELFYVQLGVLQRRAELKQSTAPALLDGAKLLQPFVQGLPFALTAAQLRVLDEAAYDMAQNVPMTRLVQGDVGSGKTAVAAGAMWIAAANGHQSAMLAPTQILAEQHHRGLERLLAGVTRPDGEPLQVALLTGRVSGSERERVLAGMRDGSVDVVVGTTAIIQDGVEFAALGLVVVDEQHRFG